MARKPSKTRKTKKTAKTTKAKKAPKVKKAGAGRKAAKPRKAAQSKAARPGKAAKAAKSAKTAKPAKAAAKPAAATKTKPAKAAAGQQAWPGRFIWHDLVTKDGERARDFYCALLDWQVQEMPTPTCVYRMVVAGPGPIGGIVEEPNVPHPHWMPYIAVADVDAAAAKITSLGGSIRVPPTDIPETGRFAVVTDPQGAFFSIYKGLPAAQGFDPDLPVPGRVCWNELWTNDDAAAQSFYGAMFGWKDAPKDMGPGGIYHVQMLGDKQAGGIMKHTPAGVPPCWCMYFFAPDLDASTARARKLGATIVMPPTPIPDVGRFSLLIDPTGATFALFQPNM